MVRTAAPILHSARSFLADVADSLLFVPLNRQLLMTRSLIVLTIAGSLVLPSSLIAQARGASTPERQVVNPPGISPLVPAYSVAIRAGNLVFVSGMTGIKPGTQDIIDGGIAVQTRQTLENIQTSLKAAGATMADVAECTVFLIDMAEYAAMNAVYQEFFRVDPPARATLAVSALPRPAARIEIKCSAVVRAR